MPVTWQRIWSVCKTQNQVVGAALCFAYSDRGARSWWGSSVVAVYFNRIKGCWPEQVGCGYSKKFSSNTNHSVVRKILNEISLGFWTTAFLRLFKTFYQMFLSHVGVQWSFVRSDFLSCLSTKSFNPPENLRRLCEQLLPVGMQNTEPVRYALFPVALRQQVRSEHYFRFHRAARKILSRYKQASICISPSMNSM